MKSFRPHVALIRTIIHAVVVASIVAGLIPPPLVTSLALSALPEPLAKPATELADAAAAMLPTPGVAHAQSSFFTLFIEVEAFSSRSAATGLDTDTWTQVADGTASGGQAMQSLDNDGTAYTVTPGCCDGSGGVDAL